MQIKTQEISLPILKEKQVRLFVKRLDQIHPFVSGNKWYKLKYNLIEAEQKGFKTLLTFGGAYSNHITATACAAKENGFKSIGIIRGEECLPLNPTLQFAKKQDMAIYYVSRSEYRQKTNQDFIKNLSNRFGDFYLIPEGGTNDLAIKGAAEILDVNDMQDYICCSVGTGGTITGMINSANNYQKVIGFTSVKGYNDLKVEIKNWTSKENWCLINSYVFGGYAKTNKVLLSFINEFYKTQKIPLDVIYTGKMMMGILDLAAKDYFLRESTILSIHTGGLQGNKGMSERLGVKLPS